MHFANKSWQKYAFFLTINELLTKRLEPRFSGFKDSQDYQI